VSIIIESIITLSIIIASISSMSIIFGSTIIASISSKSIIFGPIIIVSIIIVSIIFGSIIIVSIINALDIVDQLQLGLPDQVAKVEADVPVPREASLAGGFICRHGVLLTRPELVGPLGHLHAVDHVAAERHPRLAPKSLLVFGNSFAP
jgi:hypothetical protein